MCAARRRGNASSTSASDITGSDYSDGFRDGFLQRNGSVVRELYVEKVVKKADGNDAGDINMAYEITETCQLKSLFPTHALVQVEVDVCLRKGSRLLVELTASTGDSILEERNGKESKLTRKVNFFNYLLKEDTDNYLADGDFCLIVYNGQDPVTVKKAFEDLNPQFSGAVVHFQRKFVINWGSQEIAARLARALEEARAAKE